MYKNLFDVLTSNINVLYFLRNYIFALWQLEYVFSSIDDLQGAILKKKKNIYQLDWMKSDWPFIISSLTILVLGRSQPSDANQVS